MPQHPLTESGQPSTLARVWSDREFRRRLITEPKQALPEIGLVIPEGIEVKTVPSKGSPSDVDDASLLQFVLTRGPLLSYFFLPSPRSITAQQAVFGRILSKSMDDPAFAQGLHRAAAAAIAKVCATVPGASEARGTQTRLASENEDHTSDAASN